MTITETELMLDLDDVLVEQAQAAKRRPRRDAAPPETDPAQETLDSLVADALDALRQAENAEAEAGSPHRWRAADRFFDLSELGWTQREIAAKCKVSPAHVAFSVKAVRAHPVDSDRPVFQSAYQEAKRRDPKNGVDPFANSKKSTSRDEQKPQPNLTLRLSKLANGNGIRASLETVAITHRGKPALLLRDRSRKVLSARDLTVGQALGAIDRHAEGVQALRDEIVHAATERTP